jgi:hypothetical protein
MTDGRPSLLTNSGRVGLVRSKVWILLDLTETTSNVWKLRVYNRYAPDGLRRKAQRGRNAPARISALRMLPVQVERVEARVPVLLAHAKRLDTHLAGVPLKKLPTDGERTCPT